MTRHADILDTPESLRGPFFLALTLHVSVVAALAIYGWVQGHAESFGDKNAGGAAIGVEAVNTIPIPHRGMTNPVANDSQSEVPQTPVKQPDRVKAEKPDPDAVALKSKKVKKKLAEVASEHQKFRPFKELDSNQLTTKQAPQVSSPLYSAQAGSGRVGTGMNTTLGTRFAGYSAQLQQLLAQKWRTSDVDPRIQSAPQVIASFELMRDGSTRNVRLLQSSGIPSLDSSVQRAILDASPFPPIPPGFDHDSARVEFTFELKR